MATSVGKIPSVSSFFLFKYFYYSKICFFFHLAFIANTYYMTLKNMKQYSMAIEQQGTTFYSAYQKCPFSSKILKDFYKSTYAQRIMIYFIDLDFAICILYLVCLINVLGRISVLGGHTTHLFSTLSSENEFSPLSGEKSFHTSMPNAFVSHV